MKISFDNTLTQTSRCDKSDNTSNNYINE